MPDLKISEELLFKPIPIWDPVPIWLFDRLDKHLVREFAKLHMEMHRAALQLQMEFSEKAMGMLEEHIR